MGDEANFGWMGWDFGPRAGCFRAPGGDRGSKWREAKHTDPAPVDRLCFRTNRVGNGFGVGRGQQEAGARAVRDSREFSEPRRAGEWRRGFAGVFCSGDIRARPRPTRASSVQPRYSFADVEWWEWRRQGSRILWRRRVGVLASGNRWPRRIARQARGVG